jgi:diguanylate cyclase (GGDEF)-like protein
MELRSLLLVLIRRWWLVVPIFLITTGASLVFALSQTPTYESTARLVVNAQGGSVGDNLDALTLINRQQEVTDTFAQISASKRIQDAAVEALQLTGSQRHDVSITSRPLTGTTLVDITARASDPSLAQAYANAVSAALVDYVRQTSAFFQLSVLDEAGVPDRPVSPNVPLIVGLGAVAGLVLGTGLAVLLEILRPQAIGGMREVVDPETWAFNESFLLYRLRQEMSRSRRTRRPVTLALIDVNHQGVLDELLPRARTDALRRVVTVLDNHLRQEDMAARLEGTTFAVVLTDTTEAKAVPLVDGLRARISGPALGTTDGAPVRANPAAGVVEYRSGKVTEAELIKQARSALLAGQSEPIGRTAAFSALSIQPGT